MPISLETLAANLTQTLGENIVSIATQLSEVTITIEADALLSVAKTLRDHAEFRLDQLIDLCAMDYSEHHDGNAAYRYAVVYHFLSLLHNNRLRVKVFAGYAGWSPGQLDDEMKRDTWLVHPASVDLVFYPKPDDLWKLILAEKGWKYRIIADAPDDLSWN